MSKQSRGLAALGTALLYRTADISRDILLTWQRRSPGPAAAADLRVQGDILRTTELATAAVTRYLTTGKMQGEDEARAVAATGKAPLRDTIALAELTKLYLYWRDITIATLREEGRALQIDAGEVNAAVAAVRFGSDGSIIRMAKQFDSERTRLQRELAIEQARLARAAFHDVLTGLPNRRLFFDRLLHALDLARRDAGDVGLLFVDIDRFKTINDSLGHAGGDHVLIVVAERLTAIARQTDTIARLGGDEFVIICEQLREPMADTAAFADRIFAVLEEPVVPLDRLRISATIGIALATIDDDPDSLLRRADQAMYTAKRRQPGTSHFAVS